MAMRNFDTGINPAADSESRVKSPSPHAEQLRTVASHSAPRKPSKRGH